MYDPGGSGGAARRPPSLSTSPTFSDGFNERAGQGDVSQAMGRGCGDGEPPFVVTVAQSCTLGGAEDGGAVSGAAASGGVIGGGSGVSMAPSPGESCEAGGPGTSSSSSPGGGGAVTPAMLPELFAWKAGSALAEGVRMVLSGPDTEGVASASSPVDVSPGKFSLHSVTKRDVIVKVSGSDEPGRRAMRSRGVFSKRTSKEKGRRCP